MNSKTSLSSILHFAFKIRSMQRQVNQRLLEKSIRYPIHLSFGNELLVATVCSLREDLNLFLTHRNIIWNLYYVTDLDTYLSQIFEGSFATGSMNSCGKNCAVKYSSSILANNLPVGIGFAHGEKCLGRQSLTVIDTGDGAFEEGVVWESLHMLSKFPSRTLIILQDNNQSMYTSKAERVGREVDYGLIAKTFNLEYDELNFGDSVGQHLNKISGLLERAGDGPAFLHYFAAAYNNHHGATPGYSGDPLMLEFDENDLLLKLHDPLRHNRP